MVEYNNAGEPDSTEYCSHPPETQPTQEYSQIDPRRTGTNNLDLNDNDIADVICILHPASRAAARLIDSMASQQSPMLLHGFRAGLLGSSAQLAPELELMTSDEEGTFIAAGSVSPRRGPGDIALRFSAHVKDPACGFIFGRKREICDVVLDESNKQKRVSNAHFRIFINPSGVLMLEDLSTNGTYVDNVAVGGRKSNTYRAHPTRMLCQGSNIEILCEPVSDNIRFVVRIPLREQREDEYADNFHSYMANMQSANRDTLALYRKGQPLFPNGQHEALIPSLATTLTEPPGIRPDYGMAWSGGDKYRCTGVLGKGAFATVYLLATRMDGELFAAKELEKKRFMRRGILDKRLESEIRIMEDVRHPNIVQFYDTVETPQHLYIIMEYVPYGDLTGYLKDPAHPTLSESLGKVMTRQILDALAHLHGKGTTHRDIKPDNILIHTLEPFSVKLTDFGLSKNVNENETILRTFCGTLLYCAPEVFPFYDSAIKPKQQKRQRGSSGRSYGQLCDLWSYAAVLWHVLCKHPPYVGIVDGTGRAMFDNIMDNQLEVNHLLAYNISPACIAFLCSMLNVQPEKRPSIAECFQTSWLDGSGPSPSTSALNTMLASIDEEDEESYDEDDHDDWSMDEEELPPIAQVDGSSSFGLHPQAKRQKAEAVYDLREATVVGSSPGSVFQPIRTHGGLPYPTPATTQSPAKVNAAALRSSGVFGRPQDSSFDEDMSDVPKDSRRMSSRSASQELQFPMPPTGAGAQTLPQDESSIGEEVTSMVRDMNMESPDSAVGGVHDHTTTPGTPGNVVKSVDYSSPLSKPQALGSQELTPKQPLPFRRRIDMPVPASFYYDPYKPETHNLEYASKQSGIDYVAAAAAAAAQQASAGSKPAGASTNSEAARVQSKTEPSFTNAPFLKPQPVLGRLFTTPDSFATVSLSLTGKVTTFGRNPTCSIVYKDGHDIRIPKVALELFFYAAGIDQAIREGADWTKLDGLELLIMTGSSKGISVNNVFLPDRDEQGRKCFGRLYTGDEVCVSRGGVEMQSLTFKCEVNIGKSKKERRSRSSRFVVETEKANLPKA
jgi:serine/threonine protein kinase